MRITIDEKGLQRPRQDEIQADLEANYRTIYGQGIDLSASSPDGQLIGVFAEAVSDVVQLLEDVYLSRSIPGARGAALSRLVRLAGIERNGATYTTSPVTHTGTPGTVIPDGTLIDDTSTPAQHFVTVGAATIGTDGQTIGAVRATETGVKYAPAGTITVILNPIAGWTSVTNTSDAIPGSDQESDAALRVRFTASLAIDTKSIVDGIYSALANIPGVSDVAIFENKTGSPITRTGSTALPPNSLQVVALGGSDQAIAATIWAKASAGVTLIGSTTALVTDSQGISQTIKFDRPTSVSIHVVVVLATPGAEQPPQSVKDAVAKAVVNYGNASAKIGQQIVRAALFGPAYAACPPPYSVYAIYLGTSPNPSGAFDMVMPFTSIPAWDVSRVIVGWTNAPT